MKFKLPLTLLLALILAVSAVPAFAQGGEVEIIGGEDNPDAVREMLGYIAAPYAPVGPIKVYVGSLAEEIPFELPLPENTRIVGSVVSQNGGPTYTQLYIASTLAADELVAYFSENLPGEDWEQVNLNPGGPRGFNAPVTATAQFCYQGDEAFLDMTAFSQNDGETRVFGYIGLDDAFYPCNSEPGQMPSDDPYMRLPNLETPEGVEIATNYGGGGGGGGGYGFRTASTSTFLRSELNAGEILELYNVQIIEQGWTQVTSTLDEAIAGSNWTLTDENGRTWGGIFSIQASPTDDNLFYAEILIVEGPRD